MDFNDMSIQPDDGDGPVYRLLVDLRSRDNNRRATAISDLAAIDRPVALAALQTLLRNTDGNVRVDAAMGLLLIDQAIGVPLVLPLLADSQASVRQYVCGLLHDFGDVRAVEALMKVILQDTDPDVRHVACYALGEIGDARALPSFETSTAI
jgi:HEAT repeat protein